jgi:hypothetical protein
VVSSNGDELGWARVSVTCRELGKEEELQLLELIHCGGPSFIDLGERRHSSRPSERRPWIGCLPELHRAACRREDDDDLLLLFRSGTRPAGSSWAAKLGWHGWALVQVSASLIFSYYNSFLLFPVFCFTFF